MKSKAKQTEAKPVVREFVFLRDVDSSTFQNLQKGSITQSLSTDSIITDELEQQQENN